MVTYKHTLMWQLAFLAAAELLVAMEHYTCQ